MSALHIGERADGAAAKIEKHRQAFDAWLNSGIALDALPKAARPAGEEAHQAKNDASEAALSSLVNYHPKTLSEVSAIAAHLSVHHRLEHFDRQVVQEWLESLALCYGEEPSPSAAAKVTSAVIDELDGALSDSIALVQTLREALQSCVEASAEIPLSALRLFGTLGVVVDLMYKATHAADALSHNRQQVAA